MIKFKKVDNKLILTYSPYTGTDWILHKFENNEEISVSNTYKFRKDHLFIDELDDGDEFVLDDEVKFLIATLIDNYYVFNKDILKLSHDLKIHKDFKFESKYFTSFNKISIFRKLDDIINHDIVIGIEEGQIPYDVFIDLVNKFPNSTEIKKYTNSRISNVLREYLEDIPDHLEEYNKYMSKKSNTISSIFTKQFDEHEKNKYIAIHSKLKVMLLDEAGYTEKDWQCEILGILLILYPKYLAVIDEVEFLDIYTNEKKRLDYMLVDSNGNIDIVEIKKPNSTGVLSSNKYRGNFVPLKELSGTIMQIEKYIYYLNKIGLKGEEKLSNKYSHILPKNFALRVVNPTAIIIIGSEINMTKSQLEDFEIIKRKYRNVMDIITYEDLIRRLERQIMKFSIQN